MDARSRLHLGVVGGLLLLIAVLVVAAVAAAPRLKAARKAAASPPRSSALLPLSPIGDMQSPNAADFVTYQLKFTYLGPQKKIVASLAGRGTGRAYDSTAFVPYERPENDYGNDRFTLDTLVISPAAFKAFVDAIALDPLLSDISPMVEPNASLMILRDSGPPTRCWEHLATRDQTDQLFQLLRNQITSPADTTKVSSYRRQMAGVRQ